MFGGPGAIFWMWIAAFIGMAVKYGEIYLGMKYREKTPMKNIVVDQCTTFQKD